MLFEITLLAVCGCLLTAYLWHVNRSIVNIPDGAQKLADKAWTTAEIQAAYNRVQRSPPNIKPFLKPSTGHRYIVTGGSGLVGGWIVQHLLLRGEEPTSIRILDLKTPTQTEVLQQGVQFISTNVTDKESVEKAFRTPWTNKQAAKKPLTVFHCVALIGHQERRPEFLSSFEKVNHIGTVHVLEAAKASGATCFVATSSGSVAVTPAYFWLYPWQRFSSTVWQSISESKRPTGSETLKDFVTCYTFSKARAEAIVCDADDSGSDFRTGCIRPCHGIYGHGVENPSSITWHYLTRRGSPTWLYNTVANFANAQNVSIAHLAYEAKLLDKASADKVGGRSYFATDPNKPMTYQNLYDSLMVLAHPSTPPKFPHVQPVPFLIVSYFIEIWDLAAYYLPFISPPKGDTAVLQPGLFQACTIHVTFDDSETRRDLDYRTPITTLDGVCMAVLDWNQKIERPSPTSAPNRATSELKHEAQNGQPVAPVPY